MDGGRGYFKEPPSTPWLTVKDEPLTEVRSSGESLATGFTFSRLGRGLGPAHRHAQVRSTTTWALSALTRSRREVALCLYLASQHLLPGSLVAARNETPRIE